MLVPVVLCGGSGTRLWPLSRASYPKQFIDLKKSGLTLFQNTIQRLKGLPDLAAPIIVCNEEHRFIVASQLQELGVDSPTIILEPESRNTAPAIALAAFSAQEKYTYPNLLILPADQEIEDIPSFQSVISASVCASEAGQMVTYSVPPTRPETGYGYIELGDNFYCNEILDNIFHIKRFIEKPDEEYAKSLFESNRFNWNSGIFLFHANVYLSELNLFSPLIFNRTMNAYQNAEIDFDFVRVEKKSFLDCPSDSIDFAVMEKTKLGVTCPLKSSWTDLGSWSSLWNESDKDLNGNFLNGDVILENTHNSLIHSDNRLVAAVGIKDTIVVETADSVLVANMSMSQDLKKIVSILNDQSREEAIFNKLVHRPWGYYETICKSDRFQVKRIVVKINQKLSLQLHKHRAEHWIVVKGLAKVTCGDDVFSVKEDQSTYIPLGVKHRLENIGEVDLELIEVQSGSYLGEDDIFRFNDDYGRE